LICASTDIIMSLFLPLVPWTEYEYFHLDGTTLIPKQQKLVDQLNNPHDQVFVFLLSSKASRYSINLISTNRLILFNAGYVYMTWNIFYMTDHFEYPTMLYDDTSIQCKAYMR